MYPTNGSVPRLIAAAFLAVVLLLGVAGCWGGGDTDLVPIFEYVGIADRTYVQNLTIDSESLPAAEGGDGALTYSISPRLPAGLTFDPVTRLLSGTPAAPQARNLYTYA